MLRRTECKVLFYVISSSPRLAVLTCPNSINCLYLQMRAPVRKGLFKTLTSTLALYLCKCWSWLQIAEVYNLSSLKENNILTNKYKGKSPLFKGNKSQKLDRKKKKKNLKTLKAKTLNSSSSSISLMSL